MNQLENLDRRLFLRGLMLTSAGLIVPKPKAIYVPPAFIGGRIELYDSGVRYAPERIIMPSSLLTTDEFYALVEKHRQFALAT